MAETRSRSQRTMLGRVIKRDCSIEVIAALDQIAGKQQRNSHYAVPDYERECRSLFFGERQELRRKVSHGIPIERPSVRDPDAIEHREQEQRVFGRLSQRFGSFD